MKDLLTLVLATSVVIVPMASHAQVALPNEQSVTAVQEGQFRLSATEPRHTFELPVERPGRIRVQAIWPGPAQRLELTLLGPGATVRRARSAGNSPLSIEFTVDEAHLRAGSNWVVAVTNRGEPARVVGRTLAEYRSSGAQVSREAMLTQPTARNLEARLQAAEPQMPPQILPRPEGSDPDPEIRLTAEGSVERMLPDGSVHRSWIDRCGSETVLPDGTRMGTTCVEVVRTALTELPPGVLNDENLNGWLSELSPNLLEAVAAIVQDESEVQNYLAFEGDRPLPAKVDTRLRLLNLLLIGRPGAGQ